MIGHFLEGALVNDETLAIELIKAVGPIPGMYLDKAYEAVVAEGAVYPRSG